jgi:PIN domain nuclease of toxin-antitoxin system
MSAVLDASALVSLLAGEAGAVEVARAAGSAMVTAVNLADARDQLSRATGDPANVAAALDRAIDVGLRVLVCDRTLAEEAADLRAAHYDRSTAAVSLADCFAIAAALRTGGALLSCDGAQLVVAKKVGVIPHPIANSQGVVPEV